ncbi:hypothetical protein So717_38120 [Roseobacter cerasinus]|uniref:Uncharacterized protein n=1 Tax=Roseobacter cerasinus TaxID=2602289 RepID=A0A640VVK9_9RHOB|nr:hypothetical protein [Roseobacter cerasinus]GFE52059.1 hypothetical protein So717_38120 [Roseobacter cerasinus]
MKPRVLISLVLLALGWSGVAASAAETVYECKASHKSPNGFVGPRTIFFVDDKKGTVRVLDGIIQRYNGGPMQVEVKERSETSYRLSWTVVDLQTTEGKYDLNYTAILRPKVRKYQVNVVGINYRRRPRAEGNCTIVQ